MVQATFLIFAVAGIVRGALNTFYDAGLTGLQQVRSRWLLPQRQVLKPPKLCFSSDGTSCPLHVNHARFPPVSNEVWSTECFPTAPHPAASSVPLQEVPILPWTEFVLDSGGRTQNVIPADPLAISTLEASLGYDAAAFGDAAMWLMAQHIPAAFTREPAGPAPSPRAAVSLGDFLGPSLTERTSRPSMPPLKEEQSSNSTSGAFSWRSSPLSLSFPPPEAPLPDFMMLGDVASRWLGDWWSGPHGAELRGSFGSVIFGRPIVLSSLPVVRIGGLLSTHAQRVRVFFEGWIVDGVEAEWLYSSSVLSRSVRRHMWDADFPLPSAGSNTVDLADLARPSIHVRITGLSIRLGLYHDEDLGKGTVRRVLDMDARRDPRGPRFYLPIVEARRAVLVDESTGTLVLDPSEGPLPDHVQTAIVVRYEDSDAEEDAATTAAAAAGAFSRIASSSVLSSPSPPAGAAEQTDGAAAPKTVNEIVAELRSQRLSQTAEVLEYFWDTPAGTRGLQQPLLRFWFGLVSDADPLPPPISSDGVVTSMPLRGARKVELLLQRHVPVEAALVPLSSLRTPLLLPAFEVTEATHVNLVPMGSVSSAPWPFGDTWTSVGDDDVLAMISALKSSLGSLARLALRSRDSPTMELHRMLQLVPAGVSVEVLESDGMRVVALDFSSDSPVLRAATQHGQQHQEHEGPRSPATLPARHRRTDMLAQLNRERPLSPPPDSAELTRRSGAADGNGSEPSAFPHG